MLQVFLIPILLSFLPTEDNTFKMHVGILLGELISRGYIKKVCAYLFAYFRKRQIIILDQTKDSDQNPLFYKVQDYLSAKFAKSIESCELVPKNGDIEFNLSDMSGKTFIDISEINGHCHSFELNLEKVNENPFDDRSKAMRQIVIKSQTASPEDIKAYVKKLTSAQTKNTNFIKIYRPLIHGKKADEKTIEWGSVMVKTNKTLKNTIYAADVEEQLFGDIDQFINNEQWYADRGIPYKRGYFLYSTPGQGKTSVAKIIANKYGIPVFCLDLTTIDDNAILTKLITEINYYACQDRYILLIEDLDRTDFISMRYRDPKLSMDCFLNAIDGVTEPHGRIVIMSANEPGNILSNSALMRPGRIDKVIEFKSCDKMQMEKMFNLFYEGHPYKVDWDNISIDENMSAACVIKLLQENIGNPEIFMNSITHAPGDDDINSCADGPISKGKGQSRGRSSTRRTKSRRCISGNSSNKIEDKVRRAKRNIKKTTKHITLLSKSLEKTQTKLPLFLEKLKQKQERERLKRLKEKAERRKTYIQKVANNLDNYDEEEYETPAFLANSIALDDVPVGTITTYEVMEDH